MPTNTTTHPPLQSSDAKPNHKWLGRCIAIFLAALTVILGVTAVVLWIMMKPKHVVYTIEHGSIQNFNLTNNLLSSTFNFVIRTYNPNVRATIYYNWIKVSVTYHGQYFASSTLKPFHQPTRNVTHLKTRLVGQNEALSEPILDELKRVKNESGKIKLRVHVNAKILFKVGRWKSRDRNLTVACFPVLNFTSSENFEEKDCHGIDL